MPSTNYTVTSVVYTAVSGTNVYSTNPTAVLTITPNDGYEINASDFSWTNTDLNYVATVVFTQDGSNVLCTVTFDNPFTMPASNVDLGLCISGSAVISELSCNINLNVVGGGSNYEIQTGSPIPESIILNVSGVEGQQVELFTRTYKASDGYYFPTPPSVELSVNDYNQYLVEETPTFDSEGRLISMFVCVKYTFKAQCGVDDSIRIKLFGANEINIPRQFITNYNLDTSDAAGTGDQRTIKVFGTPGATFQVSSNNGQILSLPSESSEGASTTYTTTPTQTIPSEGFVNVDIDMPASVTSTQYCFTITGDLIDPFPQINPVCINQFAKVVLTFNTTGANLTITSTNLNGEDMASSTITRSRAANTTPEFGSFFYKNNITYKIQASANQPLTLVSDPTPSWTNLEEPQAIVTEEVINSPNLSLSDATGITTGMRMTGNGVTLNNSIPPVCTVSSVNSNDIVVDPSQANIPFDAAQQSNAVFLTFSNRKGSILDLPAVAFLDTDTQEVSLTINGSIERYGDSNQTFTLDLTSLITVGSTNTCKQFNVTVGTGGGLLAYYDCITNSKRELTVFKGQADFNICALASPAPTASGTMSVAAHATNTCTAGGASNQGTCTTWTIVYNPAAPRGKSVTITYIDCVTLAEATITVGLGSTVTQCATRQTPVSSDPGDGGATITLTDLTCSP
jgi:hypothetical protein